MNIREVYNVFLFKIGQRRVLPASYVRNKKIKDCNEQLLLLQDSNISSYQNATLYGRKSVIKKLKEVSASLNTKGYSLVVFELYRSKKKQDELRMTQKVLLQQQFLEYTEGQILLQLNKRVAKSGGGHQTGGAVDLTISDTEGNFLDMGTSYMEFNEKTVTFCDALTDEQRRNRSLLLSSMQSVGFVNFPLEWWHFSYGDKMWAAYQNKPYAIYGNLAK